MKTDAYGLLGFASLLILSSFLASRLTATLAPEIRKVVLAGFALRVVGCVLYFVVGVEVYRGKIDAFHYISAGESYARVAMGDLDSWVVEATMRSGTAGTIFVRLVAAVVLPVVGFSPLGCCLAFSLLSYVGLVALALSRPDDQQRARFMSLLAFWPSLWFWPCTVGKDALAILAVGLVGMSMGRQGGARVLSLGAGISILIGVRPHLAVVAVGAVLASEALARRQTLTQAIVLVLLGALGAFALSLAFNRLGFSSLDSDQIGDMLASRAISTGRGGSSLGEAAGGAGAALSILGFMFRPFPWEVHSVMAAACSLEATALFVFLLRGRGSVYDALSAWRSDGLVRFAMFWTLALVIVFGMTFRNTGLIARQRVAVLPFVLLMLVQTAPRPFGSRPSAS